MTQNTETQNSATVNCVPSAELIRTIPFSPAVFYWLETNGLAARQDGTLSFVNTCCKPPSLRDAANSFPLDGQAPLHRAWSPGAAQGLPGFLVAQIFKRLPKNSQACPKIHALPKNSTKNGSF
jgi:hypothetical protein